MVDAPYGEGEPKHWHILDHPLDAFQSKAFGKTGSLLKSHFDDNIGVPSFRHRTPL